MSDSPCDGRSERTAILVQSRPVVYLSRWLLRAAADAATGERVLAVVTPPESVLTTASAAYLQGARALWVIDHPDGQYAGFSGRRVHWQNGAFVADQPMHPAFLAGHPEDQAAVSVAAEAFHDYRTSPTIGTFSADVLRCAGVAAPIGHGPAEPVDRRFDPDHLTYLARTASPGDMWAAVVGADGDGVLVTTPRPAGVLERLDYRGPLAVPLGPAMLRDFAVGMLDAGGRVATLGYRRRFRGRYQAPRMHQPTAPAAFVVAESELAQVGVQELARRLGPGTEIVGRRRRGLFVDYGLDPSESVASAVERHMAVLGAVFATGAQELGATVRGAEGRR